MMHLQALVAVFVLVGAGLVSIAGGGTETTAPLQAGDARGGVQEKAPGFTPSTDAENRDPWVVVLGIAQDAGVPQAGTPAGEPIWAEPERHRWATALAVVEPRSNARWLIEATPHLVPQLHLLEQVAGPSPGPPVDGIFLTHGHMGHYTGLLHLGHEAMGARGIPVHAMPRMAAFLRENGPWEQLVSFGNIQLHPLADGEPVALAGGITVTPVQVPHRDEYTETVGFVIRGPRRAVLFLPDIDKWEAWDAQGTRLEDVLATVDRAYVDATFFADGELPGRDMSAIRHPFITETMARLAPLPAAERAKVRLIHLNHSNPALRGDSAARRQVEQAGMTVARRGERFGL